MPSLGAEPPEAPRRDDWPCIRPIRVDHHNLGLRRRRPHLLQQAAIASRPQAGIELADGCFARIELSPAPAAAIAVCAHATLDAPIGGGFAIGEPAPVVVVRLRPCRNREAHYATAHPRVELIVFAIMAKSAFEVGMLPPYWRGWRGVSMLLRCRR